MTLIAHSGSKWLTREELKQLPLPVGTRTHQPLAHSKVVDTLIEALSFRQIELVYDEYAVSADGMRMFGVVTLNYVVNGVRFAIGIRNSNDKSMRLAMVVGLNVIVCDNLLFKGEFQSLLAKHTKNFSLIDAISVGVDRAQRNFDPLKRQMLSWQEHILSENQAKVIIYDAFIGGKLGATKNLMPVVHKHYFEPELEEFKPRTLWSLSNAFTSALKNLKPLKKLQVTAKLAGFLERYKLPI